MANISDEATMGLDCSCGYDRIFYAIEQQPTTTNALNAGLAINWNGKNGVQSEIAGVDILKPQIREIWTKTMKYSAATATSYKRKILESIGKVNSSSFKGWDAGEVLFLGCTYGIPYTAEEDGEGVKYIDVVFHFLIKENKKGVNGHSYTWNIQDNVIKADGTLDAVIKGTYVAEVYEKTNLNKLGI